MKWDLICGMRGTISSGGHVYVLDGELGGYLDLTGMGVPGHLGVILAAALDVCYAKVDQDLLDRLQKPNGWTTRKYHKREKWKETKREKNEGRQT